MYDKMALPKGILHKKRLNVTKTSMKVFLRESLNLGGTFAYYPKSSKLTPNNFGNLSFRPFSGRL